MPRHKISQPNMPAAAGYVAMRAITLNGVTYHAGEEVDATGVNARRIRQMVEGRKLAPIYTATEPQAEDAAAAPQGSPQGGDEGPDGTDAPAEQENVPTAAENAPTGTEDGPDGGANEGAPEEGPAGDGAPPRYEVKHFGFGRFDVVDAEGNRISDDWITKEAAEELAASLNDGEV